MKTRDVFNIVVSYTERFKDQINYTLLAGNLWKSDKITEIFISLNYLVVVYPQLQILLPQSSMLSIQFIDLMTSVPSRDKNKLSASSSCATIWIVKSTDCWGFGSSRQRLSDSGPCTRCCLRNVPPFLNNGAFTESEAGATKAIEKCRIHVERENAEL